MESTRRSYGAHCRIRYEASKMGCIIADTQVSEYPLKSIGFKAEIVDNFYLLRHSILLGLA